MKLIRHIRHNEIDKEKWDSCIKSADNSLIYGYTWWLDNMSPGWNALVLNDYEAVMPLTWRRKYGVSYLYQPFCTAALGVFYKKNINIITTDFFDAIPKQYKYWDIDLNEKNGFSPDHAMISLRTNQMLDLKGGYDAVKQNYSRLARRTLNKASEAGMNIKRNVQPEIVINAFEHEYNQQINATDDDYKALIESCGIAAEKGLLKSYIAQTNDNVIAAFYIVLQDEKFAYSLLGGSTAEGKNNGAFYWLTDAAIYDQCGNKKIFRFEGSDKEGIAFLMHSLGLFLFYINI